MTRKPGDEIERALVALEIAAGYIALVAKGVGNMPILKDRAKSDCDILGAAIQGLESLQSAPVAVEPAAPDTERRQRILAFIHAARTNPDEFYAGLDFLAEVEAELTEPAAPTEQQIMAGVTYWSLTEITKTTDTE